MNFKSVSGLVLAALLAVDIAYADAPSVNIQDLDASHVKITQPDAFRHVSRHDFELTAEDVEGMQDMYREGVQKAFAKKGEYVITTDAETADIIVNAALINLRPAAPKDDNRSREPWNDYYSKGAGSAKIRFEIIDSDGTLTVKESNRDAGHTWQRNDRFHNRRDVKNMFDGFGRYLVKELNKIDS